jgi:hypothetical protein
MRLPFQKSLCWMIVLGTLSAVAAVAKREPCIRAEAMQAGTQTDHLKTWHSVYKFYKQFSHCDDGSIAEGVSDAVAKLLANRWDSFDEFAKLASNDKGFENFVLRHVDETIDWSHDAPKIRQSPRSHCPSKSTRLCKALVVKTTPLSK